MTSSTLPTVTFVPDYTQTILSEDPSRALLKLLSQLQTGESGGDVPPANVYDLIYNAIMSSSNLRLTAGSTSLPETAAVT
jgi:hypothetical protein